jgi:hypothetical protein
MKAEITKIKIKLKDRQIELSSDEAALLHRELDVLFKMAENKREINKVVERVVEKLVPYPVYPTPIVINPSAPAPFWPPWTPWCESGNIQGSSIQGGTLLLSCSC